MRNYYINLLILIATIDCVEAQQLAFPEPVTNNAVVALEKNGHTMFYSFFGLDSTKTWSGVHNKIFKYDPVSKRSSFVGMTPDVGRLAAGASAISNKAYVVGGYEVRANGKEKSSKHLFIFDPVNEKITSGADLLVAIDDHVQAVWKNHLLFVISGWSDSVNVSAVQVYDPQTNHWSLGTPLPDEQGAKVFGGTGLIAGDTIYCLGGASFEKNYPPSRAFYKGIINPSDPLKIKWLKGQYPGEHRYRSAAIQIDKKLYFIGGSNETYNYNGISYAGQNSVEPNKTILVYDLTTGKFTTMAARQEVMDLRGAVKDKSGDVFLLGGMERSQRVTRRIVKVKIR